jgi:hypothetical protein
MGVFDRYLLGAAVKCSLDNSVDIHSQAMATVLPFCCSAMALPHTPNAEAAFKVSKNCYVHDLIPQTFICFVIPAKAGIQCFYRSGCRIKSGMTGIRKGLFESLKRLSVSISAFRIPCYWNPEPLNQEPAAAYIISTIGVSFSAISMIVPAFLREILQLTTLDS